LVRPEGGGAGGEDRGPVLKQDGGKLTCWAEQVTRGSGGSVVLWRHLSTDNSTMTRCINQPANELNSSRAEDTARARFGPDAPHASSGCPLNSDQ
jgi:hypothetical protein